MSERAAASVRGVVQGVGFRPVVARLARSMELAGFVRNTAEGAEIEIEGEPEVLARFRARLRQCLPPAARIDTVRWRAVEPRGGRRRRGRARRRWDNVGAARTWSWRPCAQGGGEESILASW